jgi:hypothetical protein
VPICAGKVRWSALSTHVFRFLIFSKFAFTFQSEYYLATDVMGQYEDSGNLEIIRWEEYLDLSEMTERRELEIIIHSENLHTEYSSPNIIIVVHLRKVRLAANVICSKNHGYIWNVGLKHLKGIGHSQNPAADGRMLLKINLSQRCLVAYVRQYCSV